MFFNLIFSFLISIFAGWCANQLGIPLPWLLGPLLTIACMKIMGFRVQSLNALRNVGQLILGLSLGLYFSPEVIHEILINWLPILLNSLFSIFLGIIGCFILKYGSKVDSSTAFFSSSIGGASEMASLAERYGSSVDKVAAAHSLRVLLVVSIIPFSYQLLGVGGLDSRTLIPIEFDFLGCLILIAVSTLLTLLVKKTKFPNPWVITPLFIAIILSSNDIHLSSLPNGSSSFAQLLIGWSLGDKFTPGFFKSAPKFLSSVLLATLLSISLSLLFAYGLFLYFINDQLSLPTVILATTPGGIAEMSITAKVLQLGVPVVTAFHVFRLVFVVVLSGPLYKCLVNKKIL